MATFKKEAQLLSTLDQILKDVEASTKTAEAHTEAGGYAGASSHPSTKVDDRTETAQEGARSAENVKDVKEDQGAPGVDSTPDNVNKGQDSVQLNIGTQQAATGEDKSVETSSAKAGKDDPGSSHQARTDNDALDGNKYASASSILKLASRQKDLGTQLLTRLATEADELVSKRATALGGVPAEPSPATKVATEGQQAGFDLAAAMAGQVEAFDKQAFDQHLLDQLAITIAASEDRAVKTARYLRARAKQADGPPPPDAGAPPQDDGSADGGSPAAADGSGGDPGDGGPSDEELMAMLSGGQGMGGGAAGGEMAGAGDPAGGDPAGGGGDPQQILLAALQQLGISPEQAVAILSGQGGDPAGGAAGAGGSPAAKAAGWQPKTAAERARLEQVRAALVEVLSQ